MATYTFREVTDPDRSAYTNLLLAGDSDPAVLGEYQNTGALFELVDDQCTVAVALMIPVDANTIELKNIAVISRYRSQGVGREMMTHLVQHYTDQYQRMIVGTADASVSNHLFYLKNGFRFYGVRRDFFNHYNPPLIENGVRLRDMVMFERFL
ncbi:GNAT family N-acetyltransferase [Lacticaseibacillus pabuli]|uniref:GNAT family N-acetyltransferase n=1 Tax=Lacticaseibacillus pabuli TaxID=3025672 RepID=A0ABY7WPG6_9LACO|nr:GNAT family N-acetyltransferase [Lacticaseibacillus sp. KACC 23028]WDF82095.1 GNAT family N-acetyltransferase [Lacticaseibacillus sp. KACC 23028]